MQHGRDNPAGHASRATCPISIVDADRAAAASNSRWPACDRSAASPPLLDADGAAIVIHAQAGRLSHRSVAAIAARGSPAACSADGSGRRGDEPIASCSSASAISAARRWPRRRCAPRPSASGSTSRSIPPAPATGTSASPPDRRATAAARRNGVDISHLRARQVRREDFDRFDHIVALDGQNLADLRAAAAARTPRPSCRCCSTMSTGGRARRSPILIMAMSGISTRPGRDVSAGARALARRIAGRHERRSPAGSRRSPASPRTGSSGWPAAIFPKCCCCARRTDAALSPSAAPSVATEAAMLRALLAAGVPGAPGRGRA